MFVLPIADDGPTRHRPYALGVLVVLNVAIFLLTLVIGSKTVIQESGFTPSAPSLSAGLSSMFIHAGFMHIIGNMFFFAMFGSKVEDVLGHFFFLLSYFIAGAAAILLFYAFNASSGVPLVGASGAISGIVGLYIVFFPTARAQLVIYILYWEINTIRTTAYSAILIWFAEQAILSLLTEASELHRYVHTAFLAHVGGFVAGAALGILFRWLGFLNRYKASSRRHWLFGYVFADAPEP